jgi:hypothetical protein
VKFVKKLLGDNEVEAVLQRLDRLTQDEARTTAAQTLEVVYGLVQNMNGEQTHMICHRRLLTIAPTRQQGIDRRCAGCPRYVLLVRISWALSDLGIETMQREANNLNKLKRLYRTVSFANRKR